MKFLITVVLLVLVYVGAQKLMNQWKEAQSRQADEAAAQGAAEAPAGPVAPTVLPGLPPHLESSLEGSRRQGADALKIWLNRNRSQVRDPRLADIELDYVVLVAGKNFGEAREVFASVQARVPEDSPVYPKVKRLAKTYQ